MLFANLLNRYTKAKKTSSPIVSHIYFPKKWKVGPTRIILREPTWSRGLSCTLPSTRCHLRALRFSLTVIAPPWWSPLPVTAWPYRPPSGLSGDCPSSNAHAQMPPAGLYTIRLVSSHGDGVASYGGALEEENKRTQRPLPCGCSRGSLIVEIGSSELPIVRRWGSWMGNYWRVFSFFLFPKNQE